MDNYSDYIFYQSEYRGNLSIDLFNSYIVKASREIDRNVNKEIVMSNLTEKEKWKLQYVACELCDYMNTYGDNTTNARANSISIDGVSINRGVKSENKQETSKRKILDNLPCSLTRYI